MIKWVNPYWLWLLLLLIPIIALQIWRYIKRKIPSLYFSSTDHLEQLHGNWRVYGTWCAPFLFWLAFVGILLALARPQLTYNTKELFAEGINIVLVLDISTSMYAEDLKPNRFESARVVAQKFINKRVSDRIGLVIFAGKSITVCPPTLDYDLLSTLLKEQQIGAIEDGTAIGMGIATAVNRLKESEGQSRIIILLTDGQNNAGEIDPLTASDLASVYNIKIYTIGAGTRGTAPYPIQDPVHGKIYRNIRVDIDEEMLQEIANKTNGRYYRATDTEELWEIYNRIDQLEKTKVDEIIYVHTEDQYEWFLIPAIGCLLLSLICEKIWFRTIIT